MKSALIDTGCIVALLDRSEKHHQFCVDLVNSLNVQWITCEAVIAESCYLLRSIKGACDAILANIEEGIFQLPFQLSTASSSIRKLMKKYQDVPVDFADACLIHLAEELKVPEIMTLDKDFYIYRWGRNHSFDFLISLA